MRTCGIYDVGVSGCRVVSFAIEFHDDLLISISNDCVGEKKLGRVACPDPWKSGARNTVCTLVKCMPQTPTGLHGYVHSYSNAGHEESMSRLLIPT